MFLSRLTTNVSLDEAAATLATGVAHLDARPRPTHRSLFPVGELRGRIPPLIWGRQGLGGEDGATILRAKRAGDGPALAVGVEVQEVARELHLVESGQVRQRPHRVGTKAE